MFENIKTTINNYMKLNISQFLQIETGFDNVLIGKDGSMASVLKISGAERLVSMEDNYDFIANLSNDISGFFKDSGHSMQFFFVRDPDFSRLMIKNYIDATKKIANRLHLELDDLFSEREKTLSPLIVYEAIYIVLWTRPSIFNRINLNKFNEEIKQPQLFPAISGSQDVFLFSKKMETEHRSFVSNISNQLKNKIIRSNVLDAHEAITAMYSSIYPDHTITDWKPVLPGDKYKFRIPEFEGKGIGHLLWPNLDQQIFNRTPETINPYIMKIGRFLFGFAEISVMPQDIHSFQSLINRMISLGEFPWRVSFLVDGNGFNDPTMNVNQVIAGFIANLDATTKNVSEAFESLNQFKNKGGVAIKLRVTFSTWASLEEKKSKNPLNLIEERVSNLTSALKGWGSPSIAPSSGDPIESFISTTLAVSNASTAPLSIAPIFDALIMMPWFRDSSPYSKGSILFRTPDRRVWPYELVSRLQPLNASIITGEPGRGKSVLLSTLNLGFLLSESGSTGIGGYQLPKISIIDIGYSSQGLISLLKEALPVNQKHEVEFINMQMTEEFSINPFDTQLGCRIPTQLEKTFLLNFLLLLMADPNTLKAPKNIEKLLIRLIDKSYLFFSDISDREDGRLSSNTQPKLFDPKRDREITDYLVNIGYPVEKKTYWWAIVDYLFDAKQYFLAEKAQKYAVPLLSDLSRIINDPDIQKSFNEISTEDNNSLLRIFTLSLEYVLNTIKILNSPTRFNVNAKIFSINLESVAPKGDGESLKRTSLMYMLARYVSAKDYYMNEETLKEMNKEYFSYHEKKVERNKSTVKRIIFDEFHRTRGVESIQKQVEIDMREGRKYNVQIALASQFLKDFDSSILKLATNFWLLGGNEDEAKIANENIGVSVVAQGIIKNKLNGVVPGEGSPLLLITKLETGKYEHLLYNTLGPVELWAFSTEPNDRVIRDKIYKILGPKEARRKLSIIYPNGSASKDIEILRKKRESQILDSLYDEEDAAIEEIVKKVINSSV